MNTRRGHIIATSSKEHRVMHVCCRLVCGARWLQICRWCTFAVDLYVVHTRKVQKWSDDSASSAVMCLQRRVPAKRAQTLIFRSPPAAANSETRLRKGRRTPRRRGGLQLHDCQPPYHVDEPSLPFLPPTTQRIHVRVHKLHPP